MATWLWTQKQDIGPEGRCLHAMAYDSVRQRVVLFGGQGISTSWLGDTWEWDGLAWTQVADTGPSARRLMTMAYDSGRQRTVLFGGYATYGAGNALNDTWEWDGEYWTQISNSGPSPRTSHAMVYDEARQRTLLFGGVGTGLLGDSWEWDGVEWTQLEDTGPTPRASHAMAYDPKRKCVVVFGGQSQTAAGQPVYLGDTWERANGAWQMRADFGPGPTYAAGMAFDGRSVLLYGGVRYRPATLNFKISSDTWEWNGLRWKVLQDIGPGPRVYVPLVYDSARQRAVLFSGADTGGRVLDGDTWEWYEH